MSDAVPVADRMPKGVLWRLRSPGAQRSAAPSGTMLCRPSHYRNTGAQTPFQNFLTSGMPQISTQHRQDDPRQPGAQHLAAGVTVVTRRRCSAICPRPRQRWSSPDFLRVPHELPEFPGTSSAAASGYSRRRYRGTGNGVGTTNCGSPKNRPCQHRRQTIVLRKPQKVNQPEQRSAKNSGGDRPSPSCMTSRPVTFANVMIGVPKRMRLGDRRSVNGNRPNGERRKPEPISIAVTATGV